MSALQAETVRPPDNTELVTEYSAWILGERCLSKKTEAAYRWRIEYLFRFSEKHAFDVSALDLRHLQTRCPKPNTKDSALRAFRSFFGFLVQEGYRADDPSKKLWRPKIPQPPPRYLEATDAAALEQAAMLDGLPHWTLCRLYLFQGLRGLIRTIFFRSCERAGSCGPRRAIRSSSEPLTVLFLGDLPRIRLSPFV